ncbi:MAG: LysR family transcriptional regulator, partial [Gluconacetobacter diazotrophicus]|nr:LysR family transcriptional regulator [Gluconacetobacter diazotrophicus]
MDAGPNGDAKARRGSAGSPFGEGQMRLVLTVAERGNLSRAAAELGISQPAASQQLAGLEAILRRQLFRRGAREMALTSDGEAYLVYARAMVKVGDAARRHFDAAPSRGAIRLGLTEDLARTVLPTVLGMFRRDHPEFEFVVDCGIGAALFAGLDDGRYDMVLAKRRPDRERAETLWLEPLGWIGRPEAVPVDGAPVDLLAMPDPSEVRSAALEALRRAGRSWRVLFQSTSLATLEAMVAAGIGVAACGRNLRGAGLEVLGEDAGLPPIDPVEVVMERAGGSDGAAVSAFAALVRESAMAIGG